jgi:hypothetical protein
LVGSARSAQNATLLGIAFAVVLTSFSCLRSEPADGADPAAVPEIRTLVYSEAFRRRFSLPASGVQSLEPGLEAIAIRVIRSPYWGAQCFIDLYLHSDVDFDYPAGTAASVIDTTNYGLMFFLGDMSKADSQYKDGRWGKQRWRYRSREYGERTGHGVTASGPIEAYDRALLPELSVVTLMVNPNTLEPDEAPAQLWLLRAGQDVRALHRTVPDLDEVHVFTVPKPLLDHAAEATRNASKFPALPDSKGNFPEPKFSIPPGAPRAR